MNRIEQVEKMLAAYKRPRHCLLVDDDEGLRKSLEIGFEEEKEVKLTTAPHGEAALKLLNEGRKFDCILLDLNLGSGHMDGVDVFREIKNNHKDVPVAFITGYPEDTRFTEAARLGHWFAVYTKPIDFEELKSLICSLVKREYVDA